VYASVFSSHGSACPLGDDLSCVDSPTEFSASLLFLRNDFFSYARESETLAYSFACALIAQL